MKILKKNKKSHLTKNMFLDEEVDIQRFDILKYPAIDKITEKQLGFFWRPEEVDVSKDKKDFNSLTEHEQHIFTSNLKRQILLDSVQGRAPNLAFLPIASLPEIENWIETWSFFETIHSRSYTHIIRNIYADPSIVFDGMLDIKEILECGNDIAKYYDDKLKNFVKTPETSSKTKHVYHLYVIKVPKRDQLKMHLQEKGVSTGIHYPIPLPFTKAYQFLNHKPEEFPAAWYLRDQILSLPIHGSMSDEEVEYTTLQLIDALKHIDTK